MPNARARGGDELADAAEAEHAERLLVRPRRRRTSSAPTCRSVSVACACGMLRASASISATVCSAAATMFDCGALATMMPRLVAAVDVDVVDADAGAADHLQVVGAVDQLGGQLASPSGSGSRGSRRCAPAAPRALQSVPTSTSKRSRSMLDAGVGDLLRDEDAVAARSARGAHAAAGTPASRKTRWAAPTPAPCSTSWPSWASTISRPAQRREDVERAEVAAVGDPQDPALEVVLAAVGGDAELAQRARAPCRRRCRRAARSR